MADHTGRNEPCPCGSGKKYKLCCMARLQDSTRSEGAGHGNADSADERLARLLVGHFQEIGGPTALDDAWKEFTFTDTDFPEDSPHLAVFQSWLLYIWTPPRKKRGPSPVPVALDFLNRHPERLSDFERRYLLANLDAPFSFWEVLSVDPGRGFRVKDVLIGTETDVKERLGSDFVRSGDFLYSRVALLDGIGFLNGAGPVAFPPRFKPQVIGLRAEIRKQDPRKNNKLLILWDFMIRRTYLELHAQLTTPPRLVNFEGDPLEWHELVFGIESPLTAFDGLKTLGTARSRADSLKEAVRDEQGNVRIIELDWTHKLDPDRRSPRNTLLGHIRIEDKTLTVEVNSARRAEIVRAEIEKSLGPGVVYRGTQLRPSEDMLKETENRDPSLGSPGAGRPPIPDAPEIREAIRKQMEAHWKRWIGEKIPALGGITPRAASKTADGRESLDALLRDMERHEEKQGGFLSQKEFIARARKELGLD
jgi:hypothetical protein